LGVEVEVMFPGRNSPSLARFAPATASACRILVRVGP
jgi:hypothetical protein